MLQRYNKKINWRFFSIVEKTYTRRKCFFYVREIFFPREGEKVLKIVKLQFTKRENNSVEFYFYFIKFMNPEK